MPSEYFNSKIAEQIKKGYSPYKEGNKSVAKGIKNYTVVLVDGSEIKLKNVEAVPYGNNPLRFIDERDQEIVSINHSGWKYYYPDPVAPAEIAAVMTVNPAPATT